jgi:hypothetical protein
MTTEGASATLNVLANDEHPEGDAFTLTAWDETSARAGTVTCETVGEAAGECTYAPSEGCVGADTFAYAIVDGRGATATGNVAVTVEEGHLDAGEYVSGSSSPSCRSPTS